LTWFYYVDINVTVNFRMQLREPSAAADLSIEAEGGPAASDRRTP